MNNHFHVIWQANCTKAYKEIQRSILKFTADTFKIELRISIEQFLTEFLGWSPPYKKNRNHQFWKRRPLCIELFTKVVFEQNLLYFLYNPV